MKYLILVALLLANFAVWGHDDPTANHDGGPCWIWELPDPAKTHYCLFTRGSRAEHPQRKR